MTPKASCDYNHSDSMSRAVPPEVMAIALVFLWWLLVGVGIENGTLLRVCSKITALWLLRQSVTVNRP
jgi:hypothetical protein